MPRPAYVKKIDAWSIRLTVDPLAVGLTELLADWRWITPNAVTLFSFVLTLISVWLFLLGGRLNWALGAVIWHLGNAFDATDGKLARKLGVSSPFGAKLDAWLDRVKKPLTFSALILASSQNWLLLVVMAACNYLLERVPYERNAALVGFCRARGISALFDPLDAWFMLFVIGPLFGNFGFWLAVTLACQLLQILAHVSANRFSDSPDLRC